MANRSDLIRELKRVYSVLGRPYTRRQFDEVSQITSRTIEKTYGSWSNALTESGLGKEFDEYKKLHKEIKDHDPASDLKKEWEDKKKKILEKEQQRKIEWWRKQVQQLDFFKQFLEETLAKAEPPMVDVKVFKTDLKKAKNPKKPHCTLWLEFSDLQLGTLMTAEEMGGLNKHNWIIWKEKLTVWKNTVIAKLAYFKEHYNIDHVVIACLGDMVEGQDIFRGQIWQIDRHVVDQAIYGANDTAAAFIEIMLNHEDLHFDILEVFGNHGRTGRKGEHPFSCSMDKVYQRMLELQLKAVKNLKNYTYHQNEAWFYLVETYGWNHLLLHGDQGMASLWSSRPTVNGLEKGITRYNQMLQQQIHFLHCGHFHNDWQLSFNMSQILINGSFIGTSNFSATQMVASSPPVQVLHVFEPRIGLSKTERIYLVEGEVRQPIAAKSLARKRDLETLL